MHMAFEEVGALKESGEVGSQCLERGQAQTGNISGILELEVSLRFLDGCFSSLLAQVIIFGVIRTDHRCLLGSQYYYS